MVNDFDGMADDRDEFSVDVTDTSGEEWEDSARHVVDGELRVTERRHKARGVTVKLPGHPEYEAPEE